MYADRYIETFVPLYITNNCDSKCIICNMNNRNHNMIRIEGKRKQIYQQLKLLYEIEKISAVCILSGEYVYGEVRKKNLIKVIWSIKQAFNIGYERVLMNIGALYDEEIELLKKEFFNENRIVLSLFQETYDKECYKKVFGNYSSDNPKSNYDLRLSTPERWIKAGFRTVDIGILLGLKEVEQDKEELIAHAERLHTLGGEIYLSVPRVIGSKHSITISDKKFIEIVKEIHQRCAWARLILTTREKIDIMKQLIEDVSVISPGSSDVLPYTEEGVIPNNILTSQFQVNPVRKRPSEVLNEMKKYVSYIRFYNVN